MIGLYLMATTDQEESLTSALWNWPWEWECWQSTRLTCWHVNFLKYQFSMSLKLNHYWIKDFSDFPQQNYSSFLKDYFCYLFDICLNCRYETSVSCQEKIANKNPLNMHSTWISCRPVQWCYRHLHLCPLWKVLLLQNTL